MAVLGRFLLFYLWQYIPVRNLPREDGVCGTQTVAGGRVFCKLPYKAYCSGKWISRAFWYLFLKPLPLILITNPLVCFLQAQLFPLILLFLLWWISTVNGCGCVAKSGWEASVANKSCKLWLISHPPLEHCVGLGRCPMSATQAKGTMCVQCF